MSTARPCARVIAAALATVGLVLAGVGVAESASASSTSSHGHAHAVGAKDTSWG